MATRSTIGMTQEDGTIKAVYCHWDGYPTGVGADLVNYYNNKEKAEALISLGGFSALRQTLEETEAGVYGDESTPIRTFTGEKDWFENFNSGEEYFYLYREDTGWVYSEGGNWSLLKTEEEVA